MEEAAEEEAAEEEVKFKSRERKVSQINELGQQLQSDVSTSEHIYT